MPVNTLVDHVGTCPRCGRIYHSMHEDAVICDCWTKCPQCSHTMTDYTPDLAPSTYGLNGLRELQILKVCTNVAAHPDHSPFYSTQKPIEVELTREN